MRFTLFFLAISNNEAAFTNSSSSKIESPISPPADLIKVNIIPPPIKILSAKLIKDFITLILELIFAPPIIAVKGDEKLLITLNIELYSL